MIPRKKKLFLLALCSYLLIDDVSPQGERAYDRSEWIPITPDPLQAAASEIVEQKTADDRVLNLDAPAQQFNFQNDEYEYRKRRPNQVQQFAAPPKKELEHPKPRKLKHPLEYKFETPPPPPTRNQPQINYYNGESLLSPYVFEQPPRVAKPTKPQQNYYAPVPSVNPQAPEPNAPSLYEQYQLPFNASFYESLNPTSINNEFYQAINNHTEKVPPSVNAPQRNLQTPTAPSKPSIEQETVQLVYVPVESLKSHQPTYQNSRPLYQQTDPTNVQSYINQVPATSKPLDPPRQEKLKLLPQNNDFPYQQTDTTANVDSYINQVPLGSKPLDFPRQEKLKLLPQNNDFSYQQTDTTADVDSYNNQVLVASKPLDSPRQEKLKLLPQNNDFSYHQTDTTTNVKSYINQVPLASKTLDPPRQEKLKLLPQNNDFRYHQPNFQSENNRVSEPKQARLQNIEQDFIQRAAQAHRLQQQLRDEINPLKQDIITTEKPKRKPHQPPLAVFLESQSNAEIHDVLNILKGAKTIAVRDKVTPDSPRIFIGPSNLDSPDGYTKFPLPYLNNINGNRIERKIDQLPFFVAPVSYKAPPGYAKISLPSPHVGSVVVSVPSTSTTPEPILFNQNQLNPYSFSSPGYSPPQQSILSSYDGISGLSGGQYQTPQFTESTVAPPPVRAVYENTFTPRPSDVYYTPQQNSQEQTHVPQVQEHPNYSLQENTQRQPSSTVRPKYDQLHLPEVNPLELAINEFEQQQITGRYEEHSKVKHSTTRRPQSTRPPQSRGRHAYENEPTTERPATRGRVRGRGSRPTTTTTTPVTVEQNKYTVLEEFAVRDPPRTPPTESFKVTPGAAETEPLRRRPSNSFEPNRRPDIESTRPKPFDYSLSQIQFESPTTQTENNKETNRFTTGAAEIENIPANVYTLGQQQVYDFDTAVRPQAPVRLVYENIGQQQTTETTAPLQETTPASVHRFSPEFVSYENREPNQRRPSYDGQYEASVNDDASNVQQEQATEEPKRQQQQQQQQSAEIPSGYLENLFQPNFDQTYISLQDQAVRSLLSPNLLVPTTKQDTLSTSTVAETFVSPTEPIVEVPSSTEPETTTSTTRATRTRGRGRARLTTSTAATSSPRRASGRRRPVSRTTTERVSSSTAAYSYEDNGSNLNQRTRTRGRPSSQNDIASSRISTTEDDVRYFGEPETRESSPLNQNNQESYMQFEHVIDQEQVITVSPLLNQEHQINVYNVPPQTTPENQQRILEYEDINVQPKPILDVNVAHTVPEENGRSPAPAEEALVRHNIKSGGVLINNKPESTTRVSTTKTRGRTRGRSRFATSSTTTARPVARISTRPTSAPTTAAKEEPEVYGFTRQPNYRPSNLNIQAEKLDPSTSRNEQEQSVQFVGEIRPKYSQRTTTPRPSEDEDNVSTPRPRIRTRTRAPARKTTGYRQSDNDVHAARGSEQVTRRSGTTSSRTRSRGSAHYRVPENVKRESDEEDFANQNYPANFLEKLDASSSRPTVASFQIDPLDEAVDDDQSPHSSFYRPRIVAKPVDWAEPEPNALPPADKKVETTQASSDPQALALTQSTEAAQQEQNAFTGSEVDAVMMDLEKIQTSPLDEEKTTRKKSRRRGAWKLVKQRPVDPLEVSESQNYQTVLNAFGAIEKVDPYSKSKQMSYLQEVDDDSDYALGTTQKDIEKTNTIITSTEFAITEPTTEVAMEEIVTTTTPSPTKTQENIFDAIYEMFDIFEKVEKNNSETSTGSLTTSATTTTTTFPEETTDDPSTTADFAGETTRSSLEFNNDPGETTLSSSPSTKAYEVEPWEMKEVKTSTSTEISHETEICYKGRCVKSRDKKRHKQTEDNNN